MFDHDTSQHSINYTLYYEIYRQVLQFFSFFIHTEKYFFPPIYSCVCANSTLRPAKLILIVTGFGSFAQLTTKIAYYRSVSVEGGRNKHTKIGEKPAADRATEHETTNTSDAIRKTADCGGGRRVMFLRAVTLQYTHYTRTSRALDPGGSDGRHLVADNRVFRVLQATAGRSGLAHGLTLATDTDENKNYYNIF